LIIPALFAVSFLVVPVKDTVWWNTVGGRVTEHRDATGATCSLMLYDDRGSVVFEWTGGERISVTAIDWNWQFPDDWKMPVALQVGEDWISTGGGSPILQGVGHGNAVTFTLNQPVEDMLRPADHIAVRTQTSVLSIKVDNYRIGTLIARARKCRDVIGK
jgi:hypothetical protein